MSPRSNAGVLPLPLSRACEGEFYGVVNRLLNVPGIVDDEGHDGLTGFAISLVRQHKETVKEFLHSGTEPRDKNMFLAREFLKVPSVVGTPLHKWITDFMDLHRIVEKHECNEKTIDDG